MQRCESPGSAIYQLTRFVRRDYSRQRIEIDQLRTLGEPE